MTDHYKVKTVFGEEILSDDSPLHVQLRDGKFASVPVGSASPYAGKTKIVYAKKKLNVPFQKLEETLMEVDDGNFRDYRTAMQRLHTRKPMPKEDSPNETELVYVPNLAHHLQIASPNGNRKEFLDELHRVMTSHAASNKFETVARTSLDGWYKGHDVAPKNWLNFGALAAGKVLHPELAKFQQYEDDYRSYAPDNKATNDVEENLYFAYYNWLVTRLVLGHLAAGTLGSVKKNGTKTEGGNGNGNKMNVDGLKKSLLDYFCHDLTEEYCAVPLLSIKKEKLSQTPKRMSVPSLEDLSIPSKPRNEVIRDVAIIERVLLNQVSSYIDDVCPINGIERFAFMKFADLSIEERIRKAGFEKCHIMIHPDLKKEATHFGNEVYRRMFDSEEANKSIGLSKGAFRKLKEVRDFLTPVYPAVMEEHVVLSSNLIILQKYEDFRKEHGITLSARELQRFTDKFKKQLARLVEVDAAYKKEFEQTSLRPILVEFINDFVYKMKHYSIEKDPSYHFVKNMVKNPFYEPTIEEMRETHQFLKPQDTDDASLITSIEKQYLKNQLRQDRERIPAHYTESEIVGILKGYSLDEFIDRDFNIALMRRIHRDIAAESNVLKSS